MGAGLDFKSAQFGSRCEDLKSSPVLIVGFEMLHLIWTNQYLLKWGELILIQSKDWINFDPVLELDQHTWPDIQYYHVSKIKQYGWLTYSLIINEFEIFVCFIGVFVSFIAWRDAN
jgi:hypothetical protein